jgi:glutamate 5-kinase
MKKDLLVIKFGTASLGTGEPDLKILEEIGRQVAVLHPHYRIVLVSSGAVGAGKKFLPQYEGTISQKKAAAAIGNPLLLKMYQEVFSEYGITVAQSLLEKQHFSHRPHFLQLKETYDTLWKGNIIPIANENDVVSNRELKFSDNDELATLIASGFGAKKLLLCTVSGGLLNPEGQRINHVANINEEILGMVNPTKSTLGSGGMASKLTFTHLATKMGIEVCIFGMKEEDGLLRALEGKTGTTFTAQHSRLKARNKWLGSAGVSVGVLTLDEGAVNAVRARKSLLAVGIKHVDGDFTKGELVEVRSVQGEIVGIGKVRISAEQFHALQERSTVMIHADDLVIW